MYCFLGLKRWRYTLKVEAPKQSWRGIYIYLYFIHIIYVIFIYIYIYIYTYILYVFDNSSIYVIQLISAFLLLLLNSYLWFTFYSLCIITGFKFVVLMSWLFYSRHVSGNKGKTNLVSIKSRKLYKKWMICNVKHESWQWYSETLRILQCF